MKVAWGINYLSLPFLVFLSHFKLFSREWRRGVHNRSIFISKMCFKTWSKCFFLLGYNVDSDDRCRLFGQGWFWHDILEKKSCGRCLIFCCHTKLLIPQETTLGLSALFYHKGFLVLFIRFCSFFYHFTCSLPIFLWEKLKLRKVLPLLEAVTKVATADRLWCYHKKRASNCCCC